MHEKSVVDGSSGRGLRGSEKTFCQFVESCWVAPLFRGTTFWRAVGASWKPLRSLWGDLLGPLAGLRGLILALLTAPGPLLACPGPPPELSWEAWAPPWAALGGSWRLLGLLGRPGALLAAPGRPLGPFWRLLSGSWSSLGGSKVALCRKARIRRQYSVFRGFLGLREFAWRLLRLLAAPGALLAALGWPKWCWEALGWLLAGLSGSRVVAQQRWVAQKRFALPGPPRHRTRTLYRLV